MIEDLKRHILATKNFNRSRISVNGVCSRLSQKKGALSNIDKLMLQEISRLYYEGKTAWLKGDLETVADMFGILD